MRILYKLFARITGTFAARIGKSAFKSLWSRIDDEDPPKPTRLDASLSKVVAGAALEAATMAAVAAVVERATASDVQLPVRRLARAEAEGQEEEGLGHRGLLRLRERPRSQPLADPFRDLRLRHRL